MRAAIDTFRHTESREGVVFTEQVEVLYGVHETLREAFREDIGKSTVSLHCPVAPHLFTSSAQNSERKKEKKNIMWHRLFKIWPVIG